jgi:serine/threonine protein kinase
MSAVTPPSDAGAPTLEAFLQTALKSGLVKEADLRLAFKALAKSDRRNARRLADQLVRTGKLSRFQANKLLKGVAYGLIMGPYQVLAPIGKGGMGTVYMARDERDGRLCALKVLPPRKAEARMLARFRREMDLSRRVAHPHLALTFEAGEIRGVHYIAMEYIPGKNLHRLVQEEGPLRPARAARLFGEVADGLHHAHEQGLIHRDLKPSNVMITPHDHAKVLDLGLALIQGEVVDDPRIVGGQGYIVGTMDYIAPEQTTDAAGVDCRADVYAMGCSIYYALSGRPPFPGGANFDKIYCHRSEEPPPLHSLNPSLPAEFAHVVRRMMAKNPEARQATAADAAVELRAFAAGEAVQPLDRPDDLDFRRAVERYQTAEPTTDVSLMNIPAVRAAAEPVGTGPPTWMWAVAIGLLALALAGAAVLFTWR